MAQIACVVVPGLPHHVTQRGNQREPVLLEADDYRPYRRLAAAAPRRAGIPVWPYCLMPNQVHLAAPADADRSRAISAEACRHYTAAISVGSDSRTNLFQGRFGAVVMDKPGLLTAAGYITLNPMVAGPVSRSSLGMVEH